MNCVSHYSHEQDLQVIALQIILSLRQIVELPSSKRHWIRLIDFQQVYYLNSTGNIGIVWICSDNQLTGNYAMSLFTKPFSEITDFRQSWSQEFKIRNGDRRSDYTLDLARRRRENLGF